MKKRLLTILLFLGFLQVFGQTPPNTNSWISFDKDSLYSTQQYFKIKIARFGLWRVYADSLLKAQVPVRTQLKSSNPVLPSQLRLFYQGVEQYIAVKNADGDVFSSNENAKGYIEFYAEPNDGALDSNMYLDGNKGQPHPTLSLISDSATYFLTWSSTPSTYRFTPAPDPTKYAQYPALNYYYKEVLRNFRDMYNESSRDLVGSTDPDYVAGEGFSSKIFGMTNGPTQQSFSTPNWYNGSDAFATLKASIIGYSDADNIGGANHQILISYNNTPYKDLFFKGYTMLKVELNNIPGSAMSGSSNFLFSSNWGNPRPALDNMSLGEVLFRYPHTWDFSNDFFARQVMFIPETHQAIRIDIKSYPTGGPIFYDLTDHVEVKLFLENNALHGVLPAGTRAEKKCVLFQESQMAPDQIINSYNIQPVGLYRTEGRGRFINYDVKGSNSEYLIITHSALMDAAKVYADYRQNQSPKARYSTLVVNVQELYDQFYYGVNQHPMAIRSFVSYALNSWTNKPKYLFLLGKSTISYCAFIGDFGFPTGDYKRLNLVPSFGFPPADNLLTARIPGFSKLAPALATGRLSAETPGDVSNYLDKVRAYENSPTEDWMKQAIHLAGGIGIQNLQFQGYLDGYKRIFEDTLIGGHVTTFVKDQNTAVQINVSDKLTRLVEQGASLITFFGHASQEFFDYGLQLPNQYDIQPGHYSFFIANGCYAGNVHSPGGSISEQYVLIPDKGSIGFLASTALSEEGPLNEYTRSFYINHCQTRYGQPVGMTIKGAVEDIEKRGNYDVPTFTTKEILLQMTLEGDPGMIINAPAKPDYIVNKGGISFNPGTVTTEQTSFEMNAVVTNIGKAQKDTIEIRVRRIYPNGSDTVVSVFRPAPFYQDTIKLHFSIDAVKSPGLNTFEVFADAKDVITELNEGNNKDTASLLIQTSDLLPVYPMKFGIVNTNTVTLKAVTGMIFAPMKTYNMEFDTTALFNSPFKQKKEITQIGGVVSWTPEGLLKDSTVYYWRAKMSTAKKWSQSSFIYIPNRRGWSQSHIYQFGEDTTLGVRVDSTSREKVFVHKSNTISATTWNKPKRFSVIGATMNASPVEPYGSFIAKGFEVFVYDPDSLTFWKSGKYDFKQNHSNPQSRAWFFEMDDSRQINMARFLDTIPVGHYVIINSIYQPQLRSALRPELKAAFRRLGSKLIGPNPGDTTLRDTDAYILFARKGFPVVHENYSHKGPAYMGLIQITDSIISDFYKGSIATPLIGPAKSWQQIRWYSHSLPTSSHTDTIKLDVIGVSADFKHTVLMNMKGLPKDSGVINVTGRIDAATYPYLILKASLKDSLHKSAPQLDKWSVYYQGVPEVSLNPAKGYLFYKDTLQEGEVMKFASVIENVSDADMGPLKIKSFFVDKSGKEHVLFDGRKRAILSSGTPNMDTINFSTSINTTTFSGKNMFWIDVNPGGDQQEQFHYNNTGVLPFYVKKDNANPLLDVTFDGVHILDRDIVSAKPHISIRMNDENKFLALSDTSMFKLWLLPPGETDFANHRIFFKTGANASMNVRFTPADLPKNTAQVELSPTFASDGVYTLVVEGVDASRNESGAKNYKVSFEVINKSTITGVFNYPNPFSTSTRFVFVLTGSEIPTQFKIQILTVTGKVVREIMLNELGNIHVGRNITDYAWDGKDEFGDQLANGLYVYRVIATINGNAIEKRETVADKFFVKGYGKMYLMR